MTLSLSIFAMAQKHVIDIYHKTKRDTQSFFESGNRLMQQHYKPTRPAP
jgi:hypothetical protein